MDIEIVNTILRLCIEEQICLFELSLLSNYCHERNLCSNAKYILASIRNYMEIFRISRDQQRIEFFMPFEICQKRFCEGVCSNIHLCYDYFCSNTCYHSTQCSSPHVLTARCHQEILGSLVNLDLEVLSKAFRVYCQSKKHLAKQKPSRVVMSSQLNRNSSWKIQSRTKSVSKQETYEKGLQIYWTPNQDIQPHFIEVVFSNQNKSDGGPLRTHHLYQHLGVAQVFYENSHFIDRVLRHGPVIFQSFTFTPRLLQRTIDRRHLCLSNMPLKQDQIDLYIKTISKPYQKISYEYYQNDPHMIVVKYDEDIDFSKIVLNVRTRPECEGSMINYTQLYLPETLLIEYHHQQYFEDEIRKLFDQETIFHIQTYSYCSFVHFHSHADLRKSIDKPSDHFIRVTPIYIDIYSQHHLTDYLQRREMECQVKPSNIDQSEPLIAEENLSDSDEDDFHDIPSEFDDDEFVFDESTHTNGEAEFLRNAMKNFLSSLSEMEAATAEADELDVPHSLLYGDDYIVTVNNRRFALAFLDYAQFRVDKQHNPDRFRLLSSLKKVKTNRKRLENNSQSDQIIEAKSAKKKRPKRNRKKRNSQDHQDEDLQTTNS